MITVSEKRYAAAALASVSLIWGYNFIMMKIGLAYAGPFQFATLRFCLGAVCLIPVLIQPWNLASGFAASMLATCAGMFWGVSVVYVKNLWTAPLAGAVIYNGLPLRRAIPAAGYDQAHEHIGP